MTHWSRPSKWFLWRTGLCNTWFYTALISSSTVMTWHTYWITHRCTILYVCNMCFSDPDAAICHLCMYVCLWFVTFVCDINMMCVHVYERDGEVVCVYVSDGKPKLDHLSWNQTRPGQLKLFSEQVNDTAWCFENMQRKICCSGTNVHERRLISVWAGWMVLSF